jgi:hypothetical protein
MYVPFAWGHTGPHTVAAACLSLERQNERKTVSFDDAAFTVGAGLAPPMTR